MTAGVLPGLGGTSNAPVSRSGVITETHTFSPNLLNEFRFGFSRNQTFLTVTDSGFDASTIFRGANGLPLAGCSERHEEHSRFRIADDRGIGRFRNIGHREQLSARAHYQHVRTL